MRKAGTVLVKIRIEGSLDEVRDFADAFERTGAVVSRRGPQKSKHSSDYRAYLTVDVERGDASSPARSAGASDNAERR